MTAAVVIPARYHSTRFPGKPLASLQGRPMIQHVVENAVRSHLASEVIVATDSTEILNCVSSFGGRAVMTSASHQSGSDRIAEVARHLDYDIIVNVQGDEPLIRPEMIDDAVALLRDDRASIGTLALKIHDRKDIFNPHIVKVVFDRDWFALYFSRAPIPYNRDQWTESREPRRTTGDDHAEQPDFWYKHIGIYAYRRETLIRLSELPPTRLEQTEKLEQLRALENSIKIKVQETHSEIFGVDTPEDLERIEQCLSTSS